MEMTPLLTLGPLYVTPYSLTILAGVLAGLLLVWRKKAVRPLLPAVILGALLLVGALCLIVGFTLMHYIGGFLRTVEEEKSQEDEADGRLEQGRDGADNNA